MEYNYSNAEFVENGETYMICDICSSQVQSDFGFKADYSMRGEYCSIRMGLCEKCADKIIPILGKAIEEIRQQREKIIFEDDKIQATLVCGLNDDEG